MLDAVRGGQEKKYKSERVHLHRRAHEKERNERGRPKSDEWMTQTSMTDDVACNVDKAPPVDDSARRSKACLLLVASA